MDEMTPNEAPVEKNERPEWLPKKFNKPEDLAKSYTELEKKIGNFVGAPDEYQIPENISNKNLATILSKAGKELNMSQDALNKILTDYEETSSKSREEFKAGLEKLDPEKQKNVNEVIQYLKNTLGDTEAEKVSKMINSVDDLEIFDKLRKSKNATSPTESLLVNENAPTSKEKFLSSIDHSKLYGPKVDHEYRRDIQNRLKDFT